MKAIFLRALEETEDKDRVLREAIASPEHAMGRTRFAVDSSTFGQVPGSPFAYWVGDTLRALFGEHSAFESARRQAVGGLKTLRDERFLRCWWELAARCPGDWPSLAKGGSTSSFYADVYLCVDWHHRGRDISWYGYQRRPREGFGAASRGIDHYFRPGLTWPRRTDGLSFRVMPKGCIFADKGPAAFVEDDNPGELLWLCAIINSAPFGALVALQLARTKLAQSYEVGLIQQTPVPNSKRAQRGPLSDLARTCWSLKRTLDTCTENSYAFYLPALLQVGGDVVSDRAAAWNQHVAGTEAWLSRLQAKIDDRCFKLYGIDGADRKQIERGLGGSTVEDDAANPEDGEDETSEAEELAAASLVASLLSWSVGVAFGRFDIRPATGERPAPPEPEPFAPLPVCSAGMLTSKDGLPLDVSPAGYAIDFPRDGILVDDAGAPRDLVAAARRVFEHVFDDPARWGEAAEILGERDRTLRRWFAEDFFKLHLKQYSKSHRKAPIYLPLSTASRSYTVWIYYHRLTADTLFHVVVEYLDPKIRKVQEERLQVDGRLGKAEGREAAKLAKQAGELAELERELEEMKAELLPVAELPYQPNRNDGVQITAAPLWRLFRLPAWRKALEATWRKLEKGDYDWAHLANTVWPDRVRQKCKSDRSLAIAHGLEDLCEIEASPKEGRRSRRTG